MIRARLEAFPRTEGPPTRRAFLARAAGWAALPALGVALVAWWTTRDPYSVAVTSLVATAAGFAGALLVLPPFCRLHYPQGEPPRLGDRVEYRYPVSHVSVRARRIVLHQPMRLGPFTVPQDYGSDYDAVRAAERIRTAGEYVVTGTFYGPLAARAPLPRDAANDASIDAVGWTTAAAGAQTNRAGMSRPEIIRS